MNYQDKWVKGARVSKGQRECESRYEAIFKVAETLPLNFTSLDVGANLGYFSFRLAEDFPLATFVMIESSGDLLQVCLENQLDNVILLRKRVTLEDLDAIASCEHFDLVMGMNVLHHFPKPMAVVHNTFLSLGTHVVLEVPPIDDVKSCGQDVIPDLYRLAVEGGDQIAMTPSHVTNGVMRPMILKKVEKSKLSRGYVDVPLGVPVADMDIYIESRFENEGEDSTFLGEEKVVTLKGETRPWVPGINLRTYEMMGGMYPPPSSVKESILAQGLPDVAHGDIKPWNYILKGGQENSPVLIAAREDRAIFHDDEFWRNMVTDNVVEPKDIGWWVERITRWMEQVD